MWLNGDLERVLKVRNCWEYERFVGERATVLQIWKSVDGLNLELYLRINPFGGPKVSNQHATCVR